MVTKTKKRCPIGQRKDKKTRKCIGTIKKRCPNGKHRDRKTEKCKNKRTVKKKSSNAEKRVFEIPEMRRKILGYMTDCHKGNVAKYHEIESSEEDPVLVQIPKNFPSAHINITNEQSTILALADVSWKPNDNEMENIVFNNYDWKKWE